MCHWPIGSLVCTKTVFFIMESWHLSGTGGDKSNLALYVVAQICTPVSPPGVTSKYAEEGWLVSTANLPFHTHRCQMLWVVPQKSFKILKKKFLAGLLAPDYCDINDLYSVKTKKAHTSKA